MYASPCLNMLTTILFSIVIVNDFGNQVFPWKYYNAHKLSDSSVILMLFGNTSNPMLEWGFLLWFSESQLQQDPQAASLYASFYIHTFYATAHSVPITGFEYL